MSIPICTAVHDGSFPPPAEEMEVLLDFDGTLTARDVLDELIARHAVDDSWKILEQEWQAGRIGSLECLQKEFALVRATPPQVEALLAGIPLDPGAGELLGLLAAHRVPVAILSDGVESYIRYFLARLRPEELPEGLFIRANTVIHLGDRIELHCPHRNRECAAGAAHCKCHSAHLWHRKGLKKIYIGDGLSDLCPARECEWIFAKARLADALTREEIPFIPFVTLGDVACILASIWTPTPGKKTRRCTCIE